MKGRAYDVAPFESIEVIVSVAMPPDAPPFPLNGRLYVSRKFYDLLLARTRPR